MNVKYLLTYMRAFFYIILFCAFLLLSGCGDRVSQQRVGGELQDKSLAGDWLHRVEQKTSSPARAVLRTGRIMALEEKTIVRGGCWNWVNTVFIRAGYGSRKHNVFKGGKSGPYANSGLIQPGDWLYYINYSYEGGGT